MKKTVLAFLILTISAFTSKAQIAYHNIEPDTTVNSWDAFQLKPSTVASNDITIWWHPTPEVVVQTHGNCQILFNGSSPSKLELNDTITASGSWNAGTYSPLCSAGTGNWTSGATEKYLGFRFKNGTSSWYYGWLLMSVGTGASSFTVSEWAYNSVAGQPIKAGLADATGIVSAIRRQIDIVTTGKTISFTHLERGQQYSVHIADMNGHVTQNTEISAADKIDLNNYASGLYIVSLHANGFVYNFRTSVY